MSADDSTPDLASVMQSGRDVAREEDQVLNSLSAVLGGQADSGRTRLTRYRRAVREEVAVLSAPPWTRLEKADLEQVLAIANVSAPGDLAELLPEKETERNEDDASEPEGPPERFPYLYTGLMRVDGDVRILIEDAEAGTSYFRKQGERLGRYVITRITEDSLVMVDRAAERQVRLLRAASE